MPPRDFLLRCRDVKWHGTRPLPDTLAISFGSRFDAGIMAFYFAIGEFSV